MVIQRSNSKIHIDIIIRTAAGIRWMERPRYATYFLTISVFSYHDFFLTTYIYNNYVLLGLCKSPYLYSTIDSDKKLWIYLLVTVFQISLSFVYKSSTCLKIYVNISIVQRWHLDNQYVYYLIFIYYINIKLYLFSIKLLKECHNCLPCDYILIKYALTKIVSIIFSFLISNVWFLPIFI